jgi:hypothetical protein
MPKQVSGEAVSSERAIVDGFVANDAFQLPQAFREQRFFSVHRSPLAAHRP